MAGNVQALIGCFKVAVTTCTSSGDWIGNDGGTSIATKTITVPASNSGKLNINSDVTSNHQIKYSLNGAAFVNGPSAGSTTTVTLTNGQTLGLETTGNFSGDSTTGTVTDFDTGTTLGTIDLFRS